MDGIVAGVGAVIGFIPQMIILFLLLAFLEGCGYLARVAFIMDRIFRRFGLSGKSFIPMLVASGCGVPAVMATKTIENERDRRMTIMTTTMIPCGAKMPIIALVFGAIAGGNTENTWWIAPLFYFLGVFAIIISGIMLKKTKLFAGDVSPFVMELPAYHLPTVKSILMSTWERIKSYIVKAGTIIFLSTIVIWLLMNFGDAGEGFGLLDTDMDGSIQYSLMAGLGNAIGWVFAPLGFGDWQATVTSITGLVAKENVVATVGILTSLGDAGETDPTLWAAFGALFAGSVPAILAFCAFNLLCAPSVHRCVEWLFVSERFPRALRLVRSIGILVPLVRSGAPFPGRSVIGGPRRRACVAAGRPQRGLRGRPVRLPVGSRRRRDRLPHGAGWAQLRCGAEAREGRLFASQGRRTRRRLRGRRPVRARRIPARLPEAGPREEQGRSRVREAVRRHRFRSLANGFARGRVQGGDGREASSGGAHAEQGGFAGVCEARFDGRVRRVARFVSPVHRLRGGCRLPRAVVPVPVSFRAAVLPVGAGPRSAGGRVRCACGAQRRDRG